MVNCRFKRPLHRIPRAVKQQKRLKLPPIHAISRNPVKIQVHMNPILPPPSDRLVHRIDRSFVNFHPIVPVRPGPVGHREPGKIEAPLRHPCEIRLKKAASLLPTGKLR
ncbi:MAG: hypothetical protein BWY82_01640 [Verrucomicrobia bacterium ADurb.Bin474]|nr:MAG: hypothetical protein BWY82_01640 [Verrucomicrobia bacterium ADurb.Bin474]